MKITKMHQSVVCSGSLWLQESIVKKKCEIQIRQFSATFGICINKFIDSPAILYKIEQENSRKNRITSGFYSL